MVWGKCDLAEQLPCVSKTPQWVGRIEGGNSVNAPLCPAAEQGGSRQGGVVIEVM